MQLGGALALPIQPYLGQRQMSAGILHNRCSTFGKGKPPGKITKQYFFAAAPGLSCDGRGTMFLHQGIEFSQAATGSGRVQVKGQWTRQNARCACFRGDETQHVLSRRRLSALAHCDDGIDQGRFLGRERSTTRIVRARSITTMLDGTFICGKLVEQFQAGQALERVRSSEQPFGAGEDGLVALLE